MKILKSMSKGLFEPECIFQSWLRNLYFDQGSVRIPGIFEQVNLTVAGFCTASCALTIDPSHMATPASKIRFYNCYHLFWATSYFHCECISCGMWKELAPPRGKAALELLPVHIRLDLCLCAGNLSWPNCNRCGLYFVPALLHSMMNSDTEFHLHSPLLSNAHSNKELWQGVQWDIFGIGKTPQFSVRQ